MNAIGFLLSPGFQLLDFAGPASAFEAANDQLENPAYRLSVLAADEGTVTNSLGIATAAASLNNAALDTLVVVGGRIDPPLSAGTLSRIVEPSSRCRRVASVCTGAFVLAAAGLLDGRRATTHWRYAPRLQREYPSIRVEADRIFCRDGNVWTSAGITAGIDLALALIEEDHGFESPKAWPSTSSSIIVATAGNRNSQLPLIWHQRMIELPLLLAMPATTSPKCSPSNAWRNRPA